MSLLLLLLLPASLATAPLPGGLLEPPCFGAQSELEKLLCETNVTLPVGEVSHPRHIATLHSPHHSLLTCSSKSPLTASRSAHLQLHVDGYTVTADTIECGHLFLGKISSKLASSALLMDVSGTSFDCTVDHFDVNIGLGTKVSGAGKLSVSDVNFQSTLRLTEGPAGLPNSSYLQGTQATIGHIDLTLTSSSAASGAIFKLLHSLIDAYLKTALPAKMVSTVEALVRSNGTGALAFLDEAIGLVEALYPPPSIEPEPSSAAYALDLRGDTPIVSIDEGLPLDHLKLPLGSLPPLPVIPIGSLANVSLVPTSLEVSGLSSLEKAALARPSLSAPLSEAHSLTLQASVSQLTFTLQ